jgi:adenylate kinase
MAKKIIIVAGSPGAGKTTLLSSFSGMKNVSVVNMGTLMLDFGLSKKYIKTRDEIRYLPNEKLSDLRNISLKKINSMDGTIILDTHASVGENGRYLPGLPIETLHTFKNISGLIYVDAETTDIMARRKNDKSRKREKEDEPMIDNQRLINLSTLTLASSYLNVPLFVVLNRKDGLERSIAEIKVRITEILGA